MSGSGYKDKDKDNAVGQLLDSSAAGEDEEEDPPALTLDDIEGFKAVAQQLNITLDVSKSRRLEQLEHEAAGDDDDDDIDYSGGVGTKEALFWCFLGFMGANACACYLYVKGTPYTPDGPTAMQLFYAGYLIELTLSLDNLFAFYLIFKYFKLRNQVSMSRVLFWGILGAVVLRAAVVATGVALIKQSDCVLFLAAVVLLWTAVKVCQGEDDDDDDLENNGIVRCASRILPVADHYNADSFFTRDSVKGWQATPLLLVLIVIELSDIAFAMDSVPAAFGITVDGVIVWSSSMCAILCLRSLYTLLVRFVAELAYMNQAIGVVLFFIGGKLLAKVTFHFEISVSLSLAFVALVLSTGAALSVWAKKKAETEDSSSETHREWPGGDDLS